VVLHYGPVAPGGLLKQRRGNRGAVIGVDRFRSDDFQHLRIYLADSIGPVRAAMKGRAEGKTTRGSRFFDLRGNDLRTSL